METLSITKVDFINTLKKKNIVLFSSADIRKLFSFKNETTLKHLLRRLLKAQIIERLTKDKYFFLYSKRSVSDFEIANFLVIPSYISLESSLSFYGLLEQFPYQITSITLTKPKKREIRGKTFSYSRVKRENFKDFVKKDHFLIASEEKALFDYLYFASKGLRSPHSLADFASYFKRDSTWKYILKNGDKSLIKFLKTYVKL